MRTAAAEDRRVDSGFVEVRSISGLGARCDALRTLSPNTEIRAESPDRPRQLGQDLEQALAPVDLYRVLAEDCGEPPILRVVPDARSAEAVHRLLWEAMPAVSEGRVGLSIVDRTVSTAPSQEDASDEIGGNGGPFRILVVAGSLAESGGDRISAALKSLWEHLYQKISNAGLDGVVEARLAVASGHAREVQQSVGIAADDLHVIGSEDTLEWLLRKGTTKDCGDQLEPYHMLVFFGHSDAEPDQLPRGIEFLFEKEAKPRVFEPNDLVPWFCSALEAVFLFNCSSSTFGRPFLARAHHVFSVHPRIPPDAAEKLAAGLVQLGTDNKASEVVRQVRRSFDCGGWPLRHTTRRHEDAPLYSHDRALLARFCKDAFGNPDDLWQFRFGRTREKIEGSKVYIDLSLDDTAEGDAPGEGRGLGQGRDRSASAMTLEQLLARSHLRWVLRGDPGSGKSTMLRQVARRRTGRFLPLYVHLPRYCGAGRAHSADGLIQHLVASVGDDIRERLAKVISQYHRGHLLVWLLDSFDELSKEARDVAHEFIGWLERTYPQATLVLATRSGTDTGLDEAGKAGDTVNTTAWRRAFVRPMGRREQVELLGNWFRCGQVQDAQATAARYIDQVDVLGLRMRELAANPFLLTLLANRILKKLEEAPGACTDTNWLVSLKRHQLLGDVLGDFLYGEYARVRAREGVPATTRMPIRKLLRRVAWQMTKDCTVRIDPRRLEEVLCEDGSKDGAVWPDGVVWTELFDKVADKPERDESDWMAFAKYLADTVGVFRREVREGGSAWLFMHRQLLEALAAEYWLEVELAGIEDRGAAIERHLRDHVLDRGGDVLDAWTEPTALVVEQSDGSRGVLEALFASEPARAMALRVAQAVETLEPTAVAGLLASLPQYGEERLGRTKVPARDLLLQLVPGREPREELAKARLVELLAERGCDDAVPLVEVGAVVHCLLRLGERDAADSVVGQGRFRQLDAETLEHRFCLGPPQRGGQGRELWRLVPATPANGAQIGSPAGEAGRHDDEEQVFVEMRRLWMQATTVTRVQWGCMIGPEPKVERQTHPVVAKRWYEAVLFGAWLDRQMRRHRAVAERYLPLGFRIQLPSEAQWEWAARGGRETRYWSGDNEEELERVGWYQENSGRRVHAVAKLKANPYGLYDVHGNVWEWCMSSYASRLARGRDPELEIYDAPRVLRGGSVRSDAGNCRAANRIRFDPDYASGNSGFRLCCVVPPQPRS